MIFPLKDLIEFKDNIYGITSAASKRAGQLAKLNDEELALNDGKSVSLAAKQVFTKEVEFRIEKE